MSRRCSVTGKRPLTGYSVSHAHNKTKKRQFPNLQRKRIFVPELGRTVRVKLSTSALRSIDKVGFLRFLKQNGLSLQDVT